MTADPADLTAHAALREIAAGRLSAASVREACMARVQAREPVLHAMAAFEPQSVRRATARPGVLGALHVPCVTVPCGTGPAGMPPRHSDRRGSEP